jgi:hypothetical protein
MNSDFVHLEAEALYKRAAGESDNRARIRKLYNLVYGRDPKPAEVLAGLEYLRTEPLKEYEENKNREKEKEKDKQKAGETGATEQKPAPEGATAPTTVDAKPAAEGPTGPATADEKPVAPKTESPEVEADAEPDASAEVLTPESEGTQAKPNAEMGMGMMAGMPGARGGPAKPVEIKYQPTIWGRYAKLLLSSSEFIFIN